MGLQNSDFFYWIAKLTLHDMSIYGNRKPYLETLLWIFTYRCIGIDLACWTAMVIYVETLLCFFTQIFVCRCILDCKSVWFPLMKFKLWFISYFTYHFPTSCLEMFCHWEFLLVRLFHNFIWVNCNSTFQWKHHGWYSFKFAL